MQDAVWDKIENLATKLKVKNGTFRVWKSRGYVPGNWHLKLLEAGVGVITLTDLKNLSGIPVQAKRRRHG